MFKLLCQSPKEHNSPYSAKKKNKETLLLQDPHPHTIIKTVHGVIKRTIVPYSSRPYPI